MIKFGASSADLTLWKSESTIEERTLEDELLLIDEGIGAIFTLNPLGTAVWRLLSQPMTRGEIVTVVAAAFPLISEKQIQEDVDALLEQLHNKGLISRQIEKQRLAKTNTSIRTATKGGI